MHGWWFQTFFIFTPTCWGNDPNWLIFFKWVETTNYYSSLSKNRISPSTRCPQLVVCQGRRRSRSHGHGGHGHGSRRSRSRMGWLVEAPGCFGVHHKDFVTWENRTPKDWQVASPLVMQGFSNFWGWNFNWLWQTPCLAHFVWSYSYYVVAMLHAVYRCPFNKNSPKFEGGVFSHRFQCDSGLNKPTCWAIKGL